MEKARKSLKEMSIVMLILAGLSFIKSCVFFIEAGLKLDSAEYTEGALITGIVILCIFGLVLCIPEIYIGVRGIKISKNPVGTKGHIVWAIILAVISVLCVISSVSNIIQTGLSISGALELAESAEQIDNSIDSENKSSLYHSTDHSTAKVALYYYSTKGDVHHMLENDVILNTNIFDLCCYLLEIEVEQN